MTRFSEIARDIESQYDPDFDLDASKTAPPVRYIEYRLLELCETLNERLTALEAEPQAPEQLDMMVEWQASLIDLDILLATEECCALWDKLVTPYAATEKGKAALGKLVRKYGLGEICDCMRISVNQYLERTRDGEIVRESVHKAFDYIGRIASNRKRNRKRLTAQRNALSDQLDNLRNVNAGLRKENARLRAALEAVEWIGNPPYCPWCYASQNSRHSDGCQHQAALR